MFYYIKKIHIKYIVEKIPDCFTICRQFKYLEVFYLKASLYFYMTLRELDTVPNKEKQFSKFSFVKRVNR